MQPRMSHDTTQQSWVQYRALVIEFLLDLMPTLPPHTTHTALTTLTALIPRWLPVSVYLRNPQLLKALFSG